jgi:hypothetical protein
MVSFLCQKCPVDEQSVYRAAVYQLTDRLTHRHFFPC